MEISVIKVLDIVLSENKETGELKTQKLYVPSFITKKDIEEVHPGITSKGKLYKNITVIKKYSGEAITVFGNYKILKERINDKHLNRKRIGFKDGEEI